MTTSTETRHPHADPADAAPRAAARGEQPRTWHHKRTKATIEAMGTAGIGSTVMGKQNAERRAGGPAPGNAPRYDAFISYSHSADGRLAPAVQAGLQRLARPWYKVRALRIFRDETGLAVNPHLWTSIAEALDQSAYFVLLCSPDAAASPWVAKEIETWLAAHPAERILPVLTDGELVWDPAAGRYDTAASTALPPALATAFATEPRHLDLRWAHTEDQLDLRHAGFRAAIADLAAPMHGVSRDDLEGEDVRRHRSAMRLAWGGASLLLLVTILAMLAAVFAFRNADAAAASEQQAIRQREIADERSSALRIESARQTSNADRLSELFESSRQDAVAARRNADEADEQRVLAEQNAEQASQNEEQARVNGQRAEASSRDALRNAAAAQRSASAAAVAAIQAQQNADLASQAAAAAAESARRQQLAAEEAERQRQIAEEQEGLAKASARLAYSRQLAAGALNQLETDPDRALIMAVQARAFDDNSQARSSLLRVLQRVPGTVSAFIPTPTSTTDPVGAILTSDNRRVAAAVSRAGFVSLHRLPKGRLLPSPTTRTQTSGESPAVAFDPDGSRFAYVADDGLHVWDVATGRVTTTAPAVSGTVIKVAFSGDGSKIVVIDFDAVRVIDAATGAPVGTPIPVNLEFTPVNAAIDRAANRIAIVGSDPDFAENRVHIHSLVDGSLMTDLPADTGVCICFGLRGAKLVRFDESGGSDLLVLVPEGESDSLLIVWDLATGTRVREYPRTDEMKDNQEILAAVDRDLDQVVTASGADGDARVRDLATGALVGTPLDARLRFCQGCGNVSVWTGGTGFGPSGTVVAAGDDGIVRVFDPVHPPERTVREIGRMAFGGPTEVSADGSRVAQQLPGGDAVVVRDTRSGVVIRTFTSTEFIEQLVVSRNGRRLLTTQSTNAPGGELHTTFTVRDVDTGATLWSVTGTDSVFGMTFDATGDRVAVVTGDTAEVSRSRVEVRNAATGAVLTTSRTVSRYQYAPAFSPDGRWVWVNRLSQGSTEPTLISYDAATGARGRSLTDPRLGDSSHLTFSLDGSTAVAIDGRARKVTIIDGRTLRVVREVPIRGLGQRVALSPDGTRVVVSASEDRSQLFDTRTGEAVGDPIGPELTQDVRFTARGDELVVAGLDVILRVDIDPASWAEQACAIANRNLGRGEWTDLLGPGVAYARTCPGLPEAT